MGRRDFGESDKEWGQLGVSSTRYIGQGGSRFGHGNQG